jgi:hypothetical protein
MSQGSLRPMTVGNVVSAGLVLYRSNLKTYFLQSLLAHVWILLPIYGWAKCAEIHGRISRLAYQELISKPETVRSATDNTSPRMWSFLGVAFGVGLRILGLYLLIYLAVIVAFIVASVALGQQGGAVVGVLLAAILLIVGIIVVIRFYSRWVIAEVPLAVESDIRGGGSSIDRSWELTEGAVGRIQYIVVVAFLVTLPLQIVTGYVPSLFQLRFPDPNTAQYWIVYFISLAFSLLGGAMIMPFWQAIKAVIYYDLRSRREGLDFQLRDRRPLK